MAFVSSNRQRGYFLHRTRLLHIIKVIKVILDVLGRTLPVLTSKMKRVAKDISGDCRGTEIVAAEVWQREGTPRSR